MWLKRDAHQRAKELLSAYIDGELSPQEKTLVEGHLRECAECRRELETLRRTVAILRAAPRPALPRSFVIRRADVEKAPAPSPIPAFLRVAAALGAAAFVLVVGVYFLLRMLLPAVPVPLAKAPPPERAYKAVVEETPTVVVELEKAVTKEVAKEGPAPVVGGKKAPEATVELGVETQALSPVPTPTVAPVAVAPSEKPPSALKPTALPTPTPAPAVHPTPSPLPGPRFTAVLGIEPTPTPVPSHLGRLLPGWVWAIAALTLMGVGIGVWIYYRSKS